VATFVGISNRVYLAHLDLSGMANHVDFGPINRTMAPNTTFNDGGFTCVKPALMSGAGMVKGNQDFATGVLDDQISLSQIGTSYPFTVVPNPTGTVTAGDPCWLSRGVVNTLNPLTGSVGDIASAELGLAYDTAIVQAKVLTPATTSAASSNGTAVGLTGPTAAQKVYAGLHVTAFSGFSQVVFTLESDDNSGFTSATTRITFATATAATYEFASLVGDLSTETFWRLKWAKTGTGSVTFASSIGVV
jgi:hypothetical protein